MIIRRVEDLTAYQFVLELKFEAYRLINQCPAARQDKRFAGQLRDALADCEADVAEGFARKNPGDFANFLRFSLASLAESKTRLKDGVAREYFTDAEVAMSLTWEQRARVALEHLRESQVLMAEKWKEEKRSSARRSETRRSRRSTGPRSPSPAR
jgi:four helix bundle protein